MCGKLPGIHLHLLSIFLLLGLQVCATVSLTWIPGILTQDIACKAGVYKLSHFAVLCPLVTFLPSLFQHFLFSPNFSLIMLSLFISSLKLNNIRKITTFKSRNLIKKEFSFLFSGVQQHPQFLLSGGYEFITASL